MVNICSIKSCRNIGKDGIHMHKFPSNEQTAMKWTNIIKKIQPSYMPLKSSMICSAHFKTSDYNLKYKTSQDHLEMFFSLIRTRGGFNNNPTASQFEAAYKRLIVHTELSQIATNSGTNCASQDSTSILHVPSTNKANNICNNDDIFSFAVSRIRAVLTKTIHFRHQ